MLGYRQTKTKLILLGVWAAVLVGTVALFSVLRGRKQRPRPIVMDGLMNGTFFRTEANYLQRLEGGDKHALSLTQKRFYEMFIEGYTSWYSATKRLTSPSNIKTNCTVLEQVVHRGRHRQPVDFEVARLRGANESHVDHYYVELNFSLAPASVETNATHGGFISGFEKFANSDCA